MFHPISHPGTVYYTQANNARGSPYRPTSPLKVLGTRGTNSYQIGINSEAPSNNYPIKQHQIYGGQGIQINDNGPLHSKDMNNPNNTMHMRANSLYSNHSTALKATTSIYIINYSIRPRNKYDIYFYFKTKSLMKKLYTATDVTQALRYRLQ